MGSGTGFHYTTVFSTSYDPFLMADDDPETEEANDRLISEMKELRQDFQEYVDSTTQYQASRRVENIQVLIALSVVGGTISLYSGGFLESPVWQNQIQSHYWVIILKVFIGANAAFLLLKLITIPLLPISSSNIVSFIHDEVEPFLYFFAVMGVVFSLLVRAVSTPFYETFSANQREYLALLSLIFPLLLAAGYAQRYRISSTLQRERPLLMEINYLLDDLVRTGAISTEMQVKLMRNVVSALLPLPVFLLVIDNLEDLMGSSFDISEETADTFAEINSFLVRFLMFGFSPFPLSILNQLNQNLEDILVGKQSGKTELSKQEKRELHMRITELRNKSAHGELTKEDLVELNEYIEQVEEKSLDDDE